MEKPYPDVFIYSPVDTARLRYVLQWIFEEQLQLKYRLIQNKGEWEQEKGIKLIYAQEGKVENALQILPHGLMSEGTVEIKEPVINRWKHSTILFYNQPGAEIPFDIFSAVFYLISRYEEYLPHRKDKHGRYDHHQSVAAQFSFLQQPVIDEWLFHFRILLEKKFNTRLPSRPFNSRLSYDIDIAWKYLHKGSKRTWGAYVRDFIKLNWSEILERRAVLSGSKTDPYDCFAWLDDLHLQYQLKPVYFFLLGSLTAFDKNADPQSRAMQDLMQSRAAGYDTGIHPSYASGSDPTLLQKEIDILAKATGQTIQDSRQHYIKFTLPETYEQLIAVGITNDYSMGYASSNGFRAGTSQSFLWYNLSREEQTDLRVHPFAFMDATSRFYEDHNTAEAFAEWERLFYSVKKVNGTFISIWHNHLLGNHKQNKAWSALYVRTLQLMTANPIVSP